MSQKEPKRAILEHIENEKPQCLSQKNAILSGVYKDLIKQINRGK